jgi:hypothetical protein
LIAPSLAEDMRIDPQILEQMAAQERFYNNVGYVHQQGDLVP